MNSLKNTIFIFLFLIASESCSENKSPYDYFKEYEVLINEGKKEEAHKILIRILEIDKDYAPAYLALGNEKFNMKNFQDAINYYDKALEKDSKNIEAMKSKGDAYIFKGEYHNAIKNLNLALNVKNETVFFLDPKSEVLLNIRRFKEPSSQALIFSRGLAYYELDSIKQAFGDFSSCINLTYRETLDYEYPFTQLKDCYYWRGAIYEETGNLEEACNDFYMADSLGMKEAKIEIEKYCK